MCFNDCDNNFDEDCSTCSILGLIDQVPEQAIFPFKVLGVSSPNSMTLPDPSIS